MTDVPTPLTITFLTRLGCHLCDDARDELARVLDERARAGSPRPDVLEVDIESDPSLLHRHLEAVPVLIAGGLQLPLAIRPGAIRLFLAQALDGAVRA